MCKGVGRWCRIEIPPLSPKKEELSCRGIWTDRDVCACSLRTENFSCPTESQRIKVFICVEMHFRKSSGANFCAVVFRALSFLKKAESLRMKVFIRVDAFFHF